MNTAIAGLLQIAATFLLGVQRNPTMSLAAQQQAVNLGSQVVQLSTQALADITFAVHENSSLAPNIVDVADAPYLYRGKWVPLGQGVEGVSSSTSFGDLNGDGVDDAAILVQRAISATSSDFAWAALVNQGGILFNVADAPLGASVQVYGHSIQNGQLVVDEQIGSQARATKRYSLLGNVFSEVQ